MKRRDVLKGAAVAAGVAVVGVESTTAGAAQEADPLERLKAGSRVSVDEVYSGRDGRMQVELHVYSGRGACCERDSDGDGNCDRHPQGWLAPEFERMVKLWEQGGQPFRPVGLVRFSPWEADGLPWCQLPRVARAESLPLTAEGFEVFRNRRWDLIDRALTLQSNGYWRARFGPEWEAHQSHPRGLDGGGGSPTFFHWKSFMRVARKRVHEVVVRFEAVSLTELGPRYVELEGELATLERQDREGVFTTPTYYERRMLLLAELEAIEASSLGLVERPAGFWPSRTPVTDRGQGS